MEEKNNERTMLDTGKEIAKNEGKQAVKGVLKELLSKFAPYIAIGLLVILAVCAIILVVYIVYNIFILKQNEVNATLDTQSQSVISIKEDGSYEIKVENFSQQILDELEKQNIDITATGFVTENSEDMIDKYIKAEVQTSFPKIGQSDLDGIITIKRASTSTEKNDQPLTYVSAKKFDQMLDDGEKEILNCFSIDPETFKLWIASSNEIIQYYDEKGKVYNTEGGGYKKNEIDYQQKVENYSVPFNFWITLHVISQDEAFMNDVLAMVLGEGKEEPIVLTYVDSQQTQTIEYQYSGIKTTTTDLIYEGEIEYKKYQQENAMALWESGGIEDLTEGTETENIDNQNVTQYIDDAVECYKKQITSYYGQLYLTKADTWLKTSNKTINEMETLPIEGNEETTVKKKEKGKEKIFLTRDINTQKSVFVKQTTSTLITEKFTSNVTSKMYTVVDGESEIQVKEFIDLIRSYPKVENNLTTSPSNVFFLLQQTANTQKLEKIMRYVLFELTDINYGVTESDLELLLADSVITVEGVGNLWEYLLQFAHGSRGAPISEDGEYYKMYGDGVGWPTIGESDMQWKSNYASFNLPGKIMHNGEIKEVPNVAEYINTNCMTKTAEQSTNGKAGPEAKYTNAEVDAMNIYIEKELVDSIGEEKLSATYNKIVEKDLQGLNLSRQQIYPLVAIHVNFGHLPVRNEKTFKQVYQEGLMQYQEKSWEHNRYIWDNWWALLGGGARGHIPSRDATFETYVKGVFDFKLSSAGTAHTRNYMFYTKEQLDAYSYAPRAGGGYFNVLRTPENEEETFTMIEMTGEYTKVSDVDYISGYYVSTMGRTFTILNQGKIHYEDRDYWRLSNLATTPEDDEGWHTKCNRAACAIIASGYSTEDANGLITTINKCYDEIVPTTEKYWKQYGLQRTEMEWGHQDLTETMDIIRTQLQKGGYLAVWVNSKGAGYVGSSSGLKITGNIHWMAIIDYRVKDGVEQMAIADGRGVWWTGMHEFGQGIDAYALIDEE